MKRLAAILLIACGLASASVAFAQESMSVSITPPLVQLSIGPGESWTSTLKVINSNPYDATFYADVVDFAASGEQGQGTFIPLVGGTSTGPLPYSLASWITLPASSLTLKAGESGSLQYTVHVPSDAEPGGHYAAILVGTEEGGMHLDGPTMRVSSYVSSLFFVKIRGETVEQGRIREFRTAREVSGDASADLILRFENTGNTHLQPRGDITIYNMWGKERGQLFVNADSGNFGNVLPHSTRRFSFSWKGEDDLFDIGRYSAVVTLAYGDEGKQNVSAVAYFWVVPTGPVAITLGSVVCVVLVLAWFIRRYIRRALMLERARLGLDASATEPQTPALNVQILMEPLREGVVDLRRAGQASPGTSPVTYRSLARRYLLAFVFFVLVAMIMIGAFAYFHRVLVASRNFQITDVTIQEDVPQAVQ